MSLLPDLLGVDTYAGPPSPINTESAALTIEMLDAAIERLWNASLIPCGSKERPHVLIRRDARFCIECGGSW